MVIFWSHLRIFFPDQCLWISTIVGSDIYIMICGYDNLEPSSRVFVMDNRVHIWHEAPSMLAAKKHSLLIVIDGKIYIVEKITDCNFFKLYRVFRS